VSKISDSLRRVRFFLMEVRNELKKSTWPTRNELLESTAVVILSVILFSVFVGLSDTLLVAVLRMITR
jgi:preprotein translocase subunit SecE